MQPLQLRDRSRNLRAGGDGRASQRGTLSARNVTPNELAINQCGRRRQRWRRSTADPEGTQPLVGGQPRGGQPLGATTGGNDWRRDCTRTPALGPTHRPIVPPAWHGLWGLVAPPVAIGAGPGSSPVGGPRPAPAQRPPHRTLAPDAQPWPPREPKGGRPRAPRTRTPLAGIGRHTGGPQMPCLERKSPRIKILQPPSRDTLLWHDDHMSTTGLAATRRAR